MLIYKTGNLLRAEENVICHQVNEHGVMGAGLALQIANRYPSVEFDYKYFCARNQDLYGKYLVSKIGDKKYIANCFTQRDFVTNLQDITLVFSGLLEACRLNKFTIAIPYGYGCGIATGNWKEIEGLFNRLSEKYDIDISIYRLDGSEV